MLPLRMLGLVMLMILLCDADGSCPDDINPIILDPPEVIGEYGGTVFVNCSSEEEYHEGLDLKLGNVNHHIDDDESFVSGSLSLSDWYVRAECRVKLNKTLECSRDLGITIYKTPDKVSLSSLDDGPMVEGTEHLLGCDIISVAPVQNLKVIWYRDNEIIYTERFTKPSLTPVSVTSTFAINPGRHHNGAVFRCEAELDLGPEGPQQVYKSAPYPADVHYAPEFVLKPALVTVEEGGNVTLTCEARGNPPPVFTWTGTGENITANTTNLTLTQVTISATYRCTAANHLGKKPQTFYVRVMSSAPTYSPEAPAVRGCPLILTPAEVVVRYGDPVSVNCSIASNTDFSGMGWEAAVGGTGHKRQSSLSWTVEKLEMWDIKPQCYMTPKNGEQCIVEPDVTVYKTPEQVLLSAMNDSPMEEGREYLLVCNITNVAPVQHLKVIWSRGNETIHTETFTETTETPVIKSSSLRVTVDRHHNGAVFKCKAELHLGPHGPEPIPSTTSQPYTADVYYKPLIEGCSGTHTFVEGQFSLDKLPCKADGNPPPTTQWSFRGDEIKADELLNRKHSGEYTALLKSSFGSSSISINITIEYSPSFACNDSYEVKEGVNSQTPCESEGLPRAVITWSKDGKEIPTPQLWTKHDSGNYSLRATNEHGTATHTLYLDVLYAPEFVLKPASVTVDEGENVTLTCEASGNPPPVFNWTGTGENILPNTANLTLTQVATNTTYSCTAANHLGAKTQTFYVHVTSSAPAYSPEAPAVRGCPLILTPAEVVVKYGDPVSVNCSIASNTDFSGMGWEAAVGGTGYERQSSLSWTVEKLEMWDIKPQCYMTPKNGEQCIVEPDVTVYKTPDKVLLSAMNDSQMEEGREYLLVCDIINVAPVQHLKVIWSRGNETIHTETFTETTETPVNKSSSLRVTVDRHHNGAVFKCKAELHLGPHGPEPIPSTTSQPYTADVYYKPLIEGCSGTHTFVEGQFSLDKLPCKADGNPPPTTQWSFKGDEIKADELLNRKHSGEYTALLKSSFGSSSISINITIQYSPSFACNDRYEVKEGVNSQTPCESEGLPRPVITWSKDGKEIPTPQRWTKHDSGNYSLRATNEHGTATHTLYLDVLYAPVFKEVDNLPEVKEVVSGENVTLPCSAEGNPPPHIQWNYVPMLNVEQTETTGRRHRNVIITGATSTNAHVYYCVATNDVGRVTREVTLVVKDKSRGIPSVVIWLLIILLIISIIVLIILVARSCHKKHGQYDFVPSRATDGTDIPMTPTSNGVTA